MQIIFIAAILVIFSISSSCSQPLATIGAVIESPGAGSATGGMGGVHGTVIQAEEKNEDEDEDDDH